MTTKIVVTIKQILDPTGFTVNRKRERIFVNREEYIINPADLNALEMALRVTDENDHAQVIALGLGPARVDNALREALGRGADRGVLISDSALADLKTDAAGAARLLAAAVHEIGDVNLVVCGAVALDSGAGELPGRLAEALGWPMLSGVYAIEEITDTSVYCTQQAVHSEADLPALLTVRQPTASHLRCPRRQCLSRGRDSRLGPGRPGYLPRRPGAADPRERASLPAGTYLGYPTGRQPGRGS